MGGGSDRHDEQHERRQTAKYTVLSYVERAWDAAYDELYDQAREALEPYDVPDEVVGPAVDDILRAAPNPFPADAAVPYEQIHDDLLAATRAIDAAGYDAPFAIAPKSGGPRLQGISETLTHLRGAGLVALTENRYALTPRGKERTDRLRSGGYESALGLVVEFDQELAAAIDEHVSVAYHEQGERDTGRYD